ncbi:hypothetical protein Ancab_038374 [Ancistrocladus abbreviatus]
MFILLMPPQATSQSAPLSPYSTYVNYSPPPITVIIVVIGIVLVIAALLSIFLRHFAGAFFGLNGETTTATIPGRSSTARGIDASVIETFPTFLYADVKVHRTGKAALECAICLNEFEDPETLRLLPRCNHVFHPGCIDPWLSSRVTCPVCRANLDPSKPFEPRPKPFLFFCSPQSAPNHPDPSDEEQDDRDRDFIINVARSPEIRQATPNRDATPVLTVKEGRTVKKLLRSHSTGELLLEEEDCERFTLRLPEAVKNRLVAVSSNGAVSVQGAAAVASLATVKSPTSGFRTPSPASTSGGKNSARFKRGNKPHRWEFSKSPPFISRSGLTRSPVSDGEVDDYHSKKIFRPVKKSLFDGALRPPSTDVGERSSDRLCPDGPVSNDKSSIN